MKTILKKGLLLVLCTNIVYAVSWDDCIAKYNKAKKFSQNTQLSYIYMRSTKQCLIKFKNSLMQKPNPEFTVEAMSNNIKMLDEYMDELIPKYKFPKNTLKQIPKYININSNLPIFNKQYNYFKKFKGCNAIHAGDKIYTAKHCKIKDSKKIHFDLSFINSDTISDLKTSKIDLNKLGSFKYYSMSKEGMFFGVLLQEDNCKFYKVKNIPSSVNTTLDLSDLEKKVEIRSSCLAIPSNSGGGVFQDNKLVGIISKTVFNKNQFLYSVIEPIYPISE